MCPYFSVIIEINKNELVGDAVQGQCHTFGYNAHKERRIESLLTLMVIPLHTTNCYYITNKPLERHRILFTHFIRDCNGKVFVRKIWPYCLGPGCCCCCCGCSSYNVIVPPLATFVDSFSCGAKDKHCGLIKFYLKRQWTWTPIWFFNFLSRPFLYYFFAHIGIGCKSRSTGPK